MYLQIMSDWHDFSMIAHGFLMTQRLDGVNALQAQAISRKDANGFGIEFKQFRHGRIKQIISDVSLAPDALLRIQSSGIQSRYFHLDSDAIEWDPEKVRLVGQRKLEFPWREQPRPSILFY